MTTLTYLSSRLHIRFHGGLLDIYRNISYSPPPMTTPAHRCKCLLKETRKRLQNTLTGWVHDQKITLFDGGVIVLPSHATEKDPTDQTALFTLLDHSLGHSLSPNIMFWAFCHPCHMFSPIDSVQYECLIPFIYFAPSTNKRQKYIKQNKCVIHWYATWRLTAWLYGTY